MGLNSGTAKKIKEIDEDRIKITHHPPRFVQVYVDPRQSAEDMEEEALWIKNRILEGEKAINKVEELESELSTTLYDMEYNNDN